MRKIFAVVAVCALYALFTLGFSFAHNKGTVEKTLDKLGLKSETVVAVGFDLAEQDDTDNPPPPPPPPPGPYKLGLKSETVVAVGFDLAESPDDPGNPPPPPPPPPGP